ncbi:MAG: isopenicillin N synthase family dioxygenase [Acidimicrobiia bacterium]
MGGEIPVIDVGPALEGTDAGLREVAARLDEVYSSVGFGFVANHGVPETTIAELFDASARFHALPRAEKEAIGINAAHRGFIPMASSTIVTSSVADVRRPNQSESFMVMHEVGPDHPDVRAGMALAGPNQWPASAPEIRAPIEAYVRALRRLGIALTRAVAVALGMPADHLLPFFAEPVTFLRLLWYPPQPPDAPEDLFGAAPHTDYGFLTLLAQHRQPGLQVRTPGGDWLDVPVGPAGVDGTAFVMNSADILHRWSNGRWVSTPHRVINRTSVERYSAPFFFDPHLDTVVAPLPSCTPAGTAPRFEPVRYGDYLMERLTRNYRQHRERAAAGSGAPGDGAERSSPSGRVAQRSER